MNSGNSPPRILVVDDDPDLRLVLTLQIEMLGWRVTCAEDGLKAFECLQEDRYDAVVSDIRMPNCDGIDLLRKAKSAFPALPVILMTGFADLSEEQALKAGAQSLLIKPFSWETLEQSIRTALTAKNP